MSCRELEKRKVEMESAINDFYQYCASNNLEVSVELPVLITMEALNGRKRLTVGYGCNVEFEGV